MTDYVKHVYEMIKVDCQGMDAVYEDYIIKMVGNHGLEALLENKLLETCGIVNGRQLYAIR